jgi:hypothetical protein
MDSVHLVSAQGGGSNADALGDGGVKNELRRDAGHDRGGGSRSRAFHVLLL